MATEHAVEMDADEIDAFLGTGGTGVVSFGGDEGPPHSVPVSYGYDPDDEQFFFRFAVGPDSAKGDPDGAPVTFVTYEDTDEGWQSVVAEGTLESVAEADVASGVLEGLRRVHIPLYDVFPGDTDRTQFRFFRLDPDSLTGHRQHR